MKWINPPLRTAFCYALFGVLWILFSDRALAAVIDPQTLEQAQPFKSAVFIAITTLFLYSLMHRDYRRLLQKKTEKKRLFDATTSATQHILNNFLNNMMLFKVEARHDSHTTEQALALYDQVIGEAKKQIETLSAIQEPTEESIRNSVFPKP